MLPEALRVPLAGSKPWKRVAIGGGWLLLSFSIVPLWAILGYLVRLVEAITGDHEEVPPPMEYWGLLLGKGVRAFGICLVYLFLPGVALLAALVILLLAPVNDSITPAQAEAPLTVAATLAPFALYLLPAAVLRYAVTGTFRSGFSLGSLRRLWFSRTYAAHWLRAVGYVTLLHLSVIPVALTGLGLLAIPSLLFYSYLVGTYVLTTGVQGQLDRPSTG